MTEEGLSKKHKNTCPSKWWNTSIIKTLLSWNRNSSVGRQRHQRTGVCLTSLQPSVQTTGVSLNHLSLPLCTAQVLPVFHFPSAASLFPEHNGKVQCYFLVLNLIIRRFYLFLMVSHPFFVTLKSPFSVLWWVIQIRRVMHT